MPQDPGSERNTLATPSARASEESPAASVRSPDDLLARVGLPPEAVPDLDPDPDYPCRVPSTWLERIRPGDPRDPLLRQVLPLRSEREDVAGYVEDPLGEVGAAEEGLLRRLPGRALALVHADCPLHCRFCFRRHRRARQTVADPDEVAARLAGDGRTEELILSGGEPLLLDDAGLAAWLSLPGRLPSLRRLRIHSRVPVALPARVTATLCGMLAAAIVPVVLVLHCNHPQELGPSARRACRDLRAAGVLLFNQATLLRGVNDDLDVLVGLGHALCACGVAPYYLHLLDPVRGAHAFAVPRPEAVALHRLLRERTAGYLVPRLVADAGPLGGKEWLGI